jgi:hypothetical protein
MVCLLTSFVAVSAVPELTALRVDEGPELDGILDDPCWVEADWFEGFVQRDPDPGAPSTEMTRVAFVYDDRTLFVAFDCRDSEPDGVQSHLARRDSGITADDNVDVYFSPTGEGRLLYYFSTNPAGVKLDQLYTNRAQWATGQWDGHWDVATSLDDGGWIAEFAVPLANFQFDADAGNDWIFNAGRVIRRKHEETYLAEVPYTANMFYTEYGARLTGIEGVSQSLGLELVPYAKGDYRNYPELSGEDRNRLKPLGGLVLDFDVSRNLNLAATAFPDFAEIDLDPDQYVVGRDQVYLSETRPFFLENSNFFATSYFTMFYSRRIGKRLFDSQGLYEDSFIVGGGRLTGKADSMGYGAFYAHTNEAVTDLAAEPESDWGVARLTYDVTPGGYVGLIGSGRLARGVETAEGINIPAYDYAAYAADFDLYFGENGEWNVGGMGVADYDSRNPEGTVEDQHALGFEVDYTGDVVDTCLDYDQFTADFNLDETGYMWTSGMDLRNINYHLRFRFNYGSEAALRSFWIRGNANVHREWDWGPAFDEFELELSSMLKSGWLMGVGGGYGHDWLLDPGDPAEYYYGYYWVNTPWSGMFTGNAFACYSSLPDYTTGAEGDLFMGSVEGSFRPLSALQLAGSIEYYDWTFPEGETDYWGAPAEDYDIVIWLGSLNYLFTRELYLRLFAQGSTQNDLYAFRSLVGWEYLPDSNIYVAYEQWRDDANGDFRLVNQGVFLKAEYYLQF